MRYSLFFLTFGDFSLRDLHFFYIFLAFGYHILSVLEEFSRVKTWKPVRGRTKITRIGNVLY